MSVLDWAPEMYAAVAFPLDVSRKPVSKRMVVDDSRKDSNVCRHVVACRSSLMVFAGRWQHLSFTVALVRWTTTLSVERPFTRSYTGGVTRRHAEP